eukprot:SRR837773.10369.p2 GENE.SRR837773.10369~~SRR837773.10369.p2  ORF type:complete len:397 (+),score=127.26 SRR837773.10369:87-1193(+)
MGDGQALAADDVQGWCEVGARHIQEQQFVQALKAYSRAVDIDPDDMAACVGKVTALQLLKRPRGALKACALALQRLPGCQPLLGARGDLVAELGEEAQEVLDDVEGRTAPKAEEPEEPEEAEDLAAGENAPCPAATSEVQAKREKVSLKSRLSRSAALEAELKEMGSTESAAFRTARKEELIGFYRDFYAGTKAQIKSAEASKLDTSQYSKTEKNGLSIKDGHRPMPRPEHVELPEDHRKPVGTISAEELASYNCESKRHLVSLHGDLFDVSDRPDKYGSDGPYHSMSGHDITWALWSGYDEEEEWDKYFDVMRCENLEERDRRFQGLMSWWAFFESEYGAPVGRLDVYDKEWDLAPPPKVQDLCVVM